MAYVSSTAYSGETLETYAFCWENPRECLCALVCVYVYSSACVFYRVRWIHEVTAISQTVYVRTFKKKKWTVNSQLKEPESAAMWNVPPRATTVTLRVSRHTIHDGVHFMCKFVWECKNESSWVLAICLKGREWNQIECGMWCITARDCALWVFLRKTSTVAEFICKVADNRDW